jgi:hypothetical protein
MSTLDGVNLFVSGPNRFVIGSWSRHQQRRGFAGLDGEMVIDHGRRSRVIRQHGRLQALTASALAGQLEDIDDRIDGQTHTLMDNHGRTFQRVMLESFDLTTQVQHGRSFWCEYAIQYRQLP